MQAIKNLCREVGITRNDTEIPLHKLDHHIRADLDSTSERVLAVLRPLKLVLTNLPEDYSHTVEAKVDLLSNSAAYAGSHGPSPYWNAQHCSAVWAGASAVRSE